MPHLTDLLSPFARRWLRRVQTELDVVPVPVDAPRGTTAGLHADRVLLVGNGLAVGFGVRTHELALPGQLSRRLAAATGRGAVVDVVSQRGLRVEDAARLLRGPRVGRSDAVVLSLGATDAAAFTPLARWESELIAALDLVRASTATGAVVAVLPAAPIQRTGGTDGRRRHLADRHAEALDRVTAAVCAERGDVTLVRLDPTVRPPRTPDDYGAVADRLVAVLAHRLDLLAEDPSLATARAQRRTPDPELLRQAAVERAGLAKSGSNAVLDRLLQHARDLFGVSAAAVTLIDGDRAVFKARTGIEGTAVPRAVAPCNRVIRRDGPYVVPDLAGEPLAEEGWRFYAGHPLESPDGYRIGALCVLDDRPRTAIDDAALAELAERVQAELWREIQRGPRRPEDPRIDTGSLRLPALSRD